MGEEAYYLTREELKSASLIVIFYGRFKKLQSKVISLSTRSNSRVAKYGELTIAKEEAFKAGVEFNNIFWKSTPKARSAAKRMLKAKISTAV